MTFTKWLKTTTFKCPVGWREKGNKKAWPRKLLYGQQQPQLTQQPQQQQQHCVCAQKKKQTRKKNEGKKVRYDPIQFKRVSHANDKNSK